MFAYKFGKTPARRDAVKLRFSAYLDRKALKLPPHPKGDFGHETLIKATDWGMLGNDNCGDCVWAGAAHETKMLIGEAKQQVWFNEAGVLADYSQVTGYDPKAILDANDENPTDKGTDMEVAAKFRRATGIRDGHGRRHKIAAYLALEPGNMEQHLVAMYLFGAVGLGIEVPAYMPKQFDNGSVFDVEAGSQRIVGGHYLPIVGRRRGLLYAVTWGKVWPMTAQFMIRFGDESIVYLSEEALINRKSPEGFDYDSLVADLGQLHTVG